MTSYNEEIIKYYIKQGFSQEKISENLGVSKSALYRAVDFAKLKDEVCMEVPLDRVILGRKIGLSIETISEVIGFNKKLINRRLKNENISLTNIKKEYKHNSQKILEFYGGEEYLKQCKDKNMSLEEVSEQLLISPSEFSVLLELNGILWYEL